jgi:hypothetical protein
MKKVIIILTLHLLVLQGYSPEMPFKLQDNWWHELHKAKVIEALLLKESGNRNIRCLNLNENSAGVGQIKPVYIAEANRISGKNYHTWDRWSPVKTKEIITIVLDHYCPSYNLDTVAMVHNAGKISNKAWKSTRKYSTSLKEFYAKL